MVKYPKDWKSYKLGDLGDVRMCKRIFASQTSKSGEIPFYKIGTFGRKADAYIPRTLYEDYKNRFSFPKPGDTLLSAAGTIGRTVVYDGKDAYFQDSNIVWLEVSEDDIYKPYLKYFFDSYPWMNLEGTTISRLYNELIRSTPIALPEIPEQRAIAESLTSIDTHIANLTELIEKKKAIRDGALEDLVSGRTRFDGSRKVTEYQSLKELCTLITKQTGFDYTDTIQPSLLTKRTGRCFPFLQTKNFRGRAFDFNTDYYIPVDVAKNFPKLLLQEKCLLFSIVGASVGNLGLFDGSTTVFCGGAIGIAKFKNTRDVPYLYYYMSSKEGQAQIMNVVKGGAQATVTIADIRKFRIPKIDQREKELIVDCLTNMDDEIASLEAERDKMRQIKAGMMDDLLTGRVRLIG